MDLCSLWLSTSRVPYVSVDAVTPVERAAEVLDVLRSGGPPVDLILAEVELPNGKGYKMLKHIMKEERLKYLPVVSKSRLLMSCLTDAVDRCIGDAESTVL